MSPKPIVPRERALRDIEEIVDYYSREAGEVSALNFIDTLEDAFRVIADQPASGSPRYAHELDLAGLRTKFLRQFPCLIFYVEREQHIDIWRVLHAQRDMPAWMQQPDAD
jgi:toxin ParE1/3/4